MQSANPDCSQLCILK